MSRRPTIRLKVPGTRSHLFYFRKMVDWPERGVPPGSLVNIEDRDGQGVGVGFWNPQSEISIRVLASGRDLPDTIVEDRLRAAIAFRTETLKLPATSEAYRLCHAEGDGLTGLVVDRFGPVVVAQLFSRGWFELRAELTAALQKILPNTRVHLIADDRVCEQEGFQLPDVQPPQPIVIAENGAQFRVNFATGHKTGFFCDQRDNRKTVAELAAGKSVLDLCCYTGGFAIHAARGGAKSVLGVDLDEEALDTAKKNAKLNKQTVEWKHGDVYDVMRALPAAQRYDMVILDPPKLARNKLEIGRARRGYFDMNRLAIPAVAPGGIFVTCSCSGMVEEPEFLEIVRESSRAAGRELRIFKVAGAGMDHPVSTLYPEGRYLKAVFAVVS